MVDPIKRIQASCAKGVFEDANIENYNEKDLTRVVEYMEELDKKGIQFELTKLKKEGSGISIYATTGITLL